jgi:hypothetical protein
VKKKRIEAGWREPRKSWAETKNEIESQRKEASVS